MNIYKHFDVIIESINFHKYIHYQRFDVDKTILISVNTRFFFLFRGVSIKHPSSFRVLVWILFGPRHTLETPSTDSQ